MTQTQEYIICHPDSRDELLAMIREQQSLSDIRPAASLLGMEIKASRHAPRHHEKARYWRYPDDPFIEYEVSDEDWCRYFDIGHEVVEYEDGPAFWIVRVPDLFQAFRREAAQAMARDLDRQMMQFHGLFHGSA